MVGASRFPVLAYGAEAAAIEDLRILFGSGQEEPGLFDGLGPAFEADLYRSIYGDADFPAVELTTVSDDRAAVEAVGRALADGRPFQAAFIDLGSPPGNWGLDVAAAIRDLDPYLHIVLIATRCDLAPAAICARIPPADRLCVLSKPFQPLEVQHQVLAAEARGRADRIGRLSGSRSGKAGTSHRASGEPGELAELLSLLRAALVSLLDEPRARMTADREQEAGPRPAAKPMPGWPAQGLAEPAPRFEPCGGAKRSSMEPSVGSRRKRRREAGCEPEEAADA